MKQFIDELAFFIRGDTMFCVTASNGLRVGVSTKKDLQEAVSQAIEEMIASELVK